MKRDYQVKLIMTVVEYETDYDSLGSEEKLSLILIKVSLNENWFSCIECKLDSVVRNQKPH